MNHFNICPSCMHRNDCVLTAQKDKVWSCSEFDEIKSEEVFLEKVQQPKQELELA
ncbi:hypothetical protein KO504_12980 [Winogradskyella psychrotolerans]|nr:hypothetical protein [Winogradskyella psychrotolerans]MBU2922259.1 hypothetical protein [Winogradskyella psychrotolerans]